MTKRTNTTSTVTTKDLAAIAAAEIAKREAAAPLVEQGIIADESELTDITPRSKQQNALDAALTIKDEDRLVDQATRTVILDGVRPTHKVMASTALAEIEERQAEDEEHIANHLARLTGGVPVREFEKALHTVASFLALPVKRIDPRTGEIITFDMGRSEVEQMLNSVCYSAAKLLNPLDDFSTVAKVEKARERVMRDQRALSEGNEIDEVECRRNMDSLDYREVVLAGVKEAQEVAQRVYKQRTGKDFKAPAFKARGNLAKVTDQDKRNQLLAEMSKRTRVDAQRVEGDAPFDMATQSADPSQRAVG